VLQQAIVVPADPDHKARLEALAGWCRCPHARIV
jgi:hypothetical protein